MHVAFLCSFDEVCTAIYTTALKVDMQMHAFIKPVLHASLQFDLFCPKINGAGGLS